MAEWVKREYGKGEIDRAGALLMPWWRGRTKLTDVEKAYIIIQNWRTSHGLPLNVFQATLRLRAKRIDPSVIIAQRLKRFSSIMNKLVREPKMQLSQMQDLGGCRAIVKDINTLYRIFEAYAGVETLFAHESGLKCYDYIKKPKADGYRGIHIVGRYAARNKARESWNGHRVEIQLRTKLQHAFATAVETVTTFTKQPLKFGAGPPEWRRFFSLMGSALAIRENTTLVEGTPRKRQELKRELRAAIKTLNVRQRLRGWTVALQKMRAKDLKGFKWILLVLDVQNNSIRVKGFANRKEAASAVEEIEQQKEQEVDAVLVWVDSIRSLQAAYPNYYADTRGFIEALNMAIRD